jgi:TetR/AcrR family transcriptional regulator, cholesterol catabolism regulator
MLTLKTPKTKIVFILLHSIMETTEIQERIIGEAGRLFAMYGIKSVTMDTLAEDMGISKRTIYESFKDKDTLLNDVIVYFQEQQHQIANDIISNSDNVVTALFQLVKGMISVMKQVNPLLFQDMKKYHSHIFKKLIEKGDIRDHSMTCNILNQGIEQGIFRTDLNADIVNLTLHELFNLFSPDSKLPREGYHRGELFNNIIIPYLLGISTEKGRILIEEQETFKF